MLMKYLKSVVPNITVQTYETASYKINGIRICVNQNLCFKQKYNNNNNNNNRVKSTAMLHSVAG
jgi:hypothetical protein